MAKSTRSSSAPHASSRSTKKRALIYALSALEHDVERLPREFEYVIHPGKHLFLTYLRGIAYGLGALTVVVFVIPFTLWFLQKIPWVPIVGDFVNKVVTRIEQVQRAP